MFISFNLFLVNKFIYIINLMSINGPVIAMRLEGKIENVNKIIYLFGDIHYPKNKQSDCGKNGIDFIKYLKSNIQHSNDTVFDLFFELGPLHKNTIVPTINKKHIDKIAHFFIKSINVKDNKNLGTLIDKKENKKLRLHYV